MLVKGFAREDRSATDPLPRSSAIAIARQAEQAGFDALWLAGAGENYVKAAVLLNSTERVTVGTAIAPASSASPAFHASMAAYLQHMSENRFILGFGSQTKGLLRRLLGADVSKIAKRARETLEVTRGILSGSPFEYERILTTCTNVNHHELMSPVPIYFLGLGRSAFAMRVSSPMASSRIQYSRVSTTRRLCGRGFRRDSADRVVREQTLRWSQCR